jgi:hypothetical protein
MTQEQKDILLKDLCTRLPYGVKAEKYTIRIDGEFVPIANIEIVTAKDILARNECPGYTIKPYLFPLSSMSEWQDRELEILMKNSIESCGMLSPYDCLEMERFFNENHLDWRGLIPMGLAIDATGLNIY